MQTADKEHIIAIMDEYTKACEKHPKFCDKLTTKDLDNIQKELRILRLLNNFDDVSASYILDEKIDEVLEAYLEGDKAHAMQELAQCGAVILRMMDFVKEAKEKILTLQKQDIFAGL